MTTARTRYTVSLAGMITVALGLGAFGGGPSRVAGDGPESVGRLPPAIRVDSIGRMHALAHRLGDQRGWLLDRVAAGGTGAVATTGTTVPAAQTAAAPGTQA